MKKIFLLAVAAVIFAGCRAPEFYQDQAVQKTRSFLLKKCTGLTYEESSYIRYNKPVILHNNIIGGTDTLEASSILSDMNQIQIVWHIPDHEHFYSVWGVSSSTMRDFTPERLFIKKFNPEDINRVNAVKKARAYIIGNLFSTLSVEDYNDLRFRNPQIFYSKFALEKSLMPEDGKVQIALVWPLRSNSARRVVVIGNSDKNLAGFKPVSGSELPETSVTPELLEPYKFMSPADLRKNNEKVPAAPAEKASESVAGNSAEKIEKPAEDKKDMKTVASEEIKTDSDIAATEQESGSEKKVQEEKITDELPEAPELDTENDLKEPEK